MKEWKNNIRLVDPYVAGEQPQFEHMIKLNTNENPFPPSPLVTEVLKNLNTEKLKLYPDTSSKVLVHELAEYYGLDDTQIFVGVGSDDVLAMAFLTFFYSDKPILFADITYSFYEVWASLYHIPYRLVPTGKGFTLDKEGYYQENGGIVIANPNAPTSLAVSRDFIEDILIHNRKSVVIVDEAYVDFGAESALPLIEKYDNLLVIQTFSKSRSLAGMRIGYAMGNPELIEALVNIKNAYNSYTMNTASILCGAAAVKDTAYFRNSIKRIVDTREYVQNELLNMGFQVLDSKTNFLFIHHDKICAKELFDALRQENIFVRYFNKPGIDDYLRVTIGTKDQMQVFLGFLSTYFQTTVTHQNE
ncbi:MAG: histidinol-phosphate transaminase [Lachnospiraceae bacterium]|nr:histidinol-phosphate transaminase [Lachnospiraceae bacterium]